MTRQTGVVLVIMLVGVAVATATKQYDIAIIGLCLAVCWRLWHLSPQATRTRTNWRWLVGAFLVFPVLPFSCAAWRQRSTRELPLPPRPPGPIVTQREYAQLKSGMDYAEVVAIIGYPGERTSQDDSLSAREWTNDDGSRLKAYFSGDKLQSMEASGKFPP